MIPTKDHDSISRWAKAHDAVPAEIKPLIFDGQPAVLHFLIGDAKAGTPEILPISWESFFAHFDLMELSMVFDEATPRFDIVRVEKPLPLQLPN